ncbi:hypothetical protein Tco_0518149 [Tanacetum coccineum]
MYIYGLAPQIYGMVAATKPETIQKAMQKAEPSRNRNVRDDNKRTRTRNTFAITSNPMRREYMGMIPKCANCKLHHTPESPYQACFNYNHLRNLAKDCRVGPRMVNSVNARNPTAAHGTCFECGGTDHFKAACPSADYHFVSTVFTPLLVIEINNLGFTYEFKIASSKSFVVIVRMDWLFKHKAEIIYHEKVVRIPLRNGKTHRFIGEKPKEKLHLNLTYNRVPSSDRNVRDDTKRTRTGNAFATTTNLVMETMLIGQVEERSYWGKGGSPGPNIVTDTFTLNNHYATTLFDSGANYRFDSRIFTPLLGIETSNLGFSYEIEIASGQLVEINKVIRGYKVEIEWYTFDIDPIPFGSGSFDVIVEIN